MDDDDILFAILVSDVARLLRTELDRRARGAGLTRSQWLALSRLARFPGVSLSGLAEMLEMEKAPAGRLIDRLEDGGWVTREPDPSDRRIKRLYPTAEAEAIYKKMRKIARETMSEAFAGLSAHEHDQTCMVMATVKSRLQEMTGQTTAGTIDSGKNNAYDHDLNQDHKETTPDVRP